MDTTRVPCYAVEAVFTIAEPAPRRRQLRFRQSDIDAWLARLEGEDHNRHSAARRRSVTRGRPRTVLGTVGEIAVNDITGVASGHVPRP